MAGWLCALALLAAPTVALAHDVSHSDRAFVQTVTGPAFAPFFYLGAKHMVTGYDHVLFLIGVVLLLRSMREVAIFVSMFTIGHSTTLMLGVLCGFGANAHLIDAIIGLSVVYKGIDNLGGFERIGLRLSPRAAILVFGLFHGLGLATKLNDLAMPANGLVTNLIAFNIGIETGQVLVLAPIVALLSACRSARGFARVAQIASGALVACGLAIVIQQSMEFIAS
ncbi:HupE/UreJ family protein [Novosphingobium cyanobacteriorum]|uniref:HupE/UreJ family protein n=1 Tax=Novosphingobium cyanobacteriorum TaxID=3024215 RepID=A0ABT6CIW0_9SPHN|nr:HupE/UreJ family protein [Novosphingobium cyanobacteriorum]MDF8333736.1 HupE/UreJ family protein [Novosphingobium cyanobacteriorum]